MTISATPRIKKNWLALHWIALLVLLTAIFFRVWNLWDRGLFYFDESLFVSNGRYFGNLLRVAANSIIHFSFDTQTFTQQAHEMWLQGGSPWMHAKPLHEIPTIIAAFIFGDYSGVVQYVSAIAGIANLVVLFFTPEKKLGWIGLLAGSFLSLSVWHLHYSRAALSQSISLLSISLVMLLAFRWHLHPSKRNLVYTSVATGVALTSHYNLFWLPPLMWLWLAWNYWKIQKPWADLISQMGMSGLIMGFPLCVIQIFSYGIKAVAWRLIPNHPELVNQFQTYFEQLYSQIFYWTYTPREGISLAYLPDFIFHVESPFLSALFLGGVFYLIKGTFQG